MGRRGATSEIAQGILPSGDLIRVRVQAEHAATSDGVSGPTDVGLKQRVAPSAETLTCTLDQLSVAAETETFRLTAALETADPGCQLLKLGLGEVTRGMSGAPVLELGTGEVIGMLGG